MAQPLVDTQPEERRIHNFNEVSLGYSKKIALEESRRCPQCQDAVCIKGCPLGVDIPKFIRYLRENDSVRALAKIRESHSLPGVCGRICTAPCETACVLTEELAPIGIRALERQAADQGRVRLTPKQCRGKKIAIIGSGPAGLSAAAELAKKDYQVTIFEALNRAGGILRYGIPEFRLPQKVLDAEIDYITSLGVTIKTNCVFGQTLTLKEIFALKFSAVFLAVGAGSPRLSDMPGSSFGGVFYAEEFLYRVNHLKASIFAKSETPFYLGKKVAVIGSGNTALDCARVCRRLGREVRLVFKRTEDEMHVGSKERQHGKEEGITFSPFTKALEILATEEHFVRGLRCMHMDYADPNSSGQWQLIPVDGSEFEVEADSVILSIGHQPNTLISRMVPELRFNEDLSVWTDEKGMTSIDHVFAGGNIATGAGVLVDAMASGKKTATHIDEYLRCAAQVA